MNLLADTHALRLLIEVERDASLWGQPHRITPRLVSEVLGDGKQLIHLTPIMTRPNYYVARIDSSHDLDDSEEWLEPLLQLIDAEYCNATDSCCEDCPCSAVSGDWSDCPNVAAHAFPAFHGGGESWGEESLDDYVVRERVA